ncbi:SDR family NAD(P)-dependent oxidoreductase [Mycobacterium sp. CVI_P3]|uniref:3-oxoacyl-[acyl-carrier-protein] reductase MabA n=1 Tax=Mycobacterium pinniadriaticum TaxID=2994102 RepID=A0ABT3S735_9MYCO|nr:SDR family oxidoreductase [Mycobacterium pinniadriaticum]MCX2928824.1 SDR family NAD(P)-dependent oxidoreductase [Mycobacterium pinniadriaticum]MCX2935309.1 SDR family NAD(P)-dependent oxidoreductase [Mycobacterium pinniadriaticum]
MTTALVTGATSGIGYAIALELARGGADVIVHGRDAERGRKVVQDIENAGGAARFIAADLSNAEEVGRLARAAGQVDILVNNAGIYTFAATADTTDADFDAQLNTNLRAPFILVRELVPGMAARGTGAVVNITTVVASTPGQGAGGYGASKAGLELFTKVWADEFGKSGVRVNAVSPGPTETPGTAGIPGFIDGLAQTRALGRVARADEIAGVVAFLVSRAAGFINGAIVPVDGGAVALSA